MDVIQSELSRDYSHIIRTDADEIIAYDVKRYGGFEDLAAQCDGFLMSTGLQLVDDGRNLFRGPGDIRLPKRSVFDSRYSKAWLTDGDWKLRDHAVTNTQASDGTKIFRIKRGFWKGPAHWPAGSSGLCRNEPTPHNLRHLRKMKIT